MGVRIGIINITGGGISGGYRNYLSNILPRVAAHPSVDALLNILPNPLQKEPFFLNNGHIATVFCDPYRRSRLRRDRTIEEALEQFSPDVIFIPVERPFHFKRVPIVRMIQNMEPFVTGTMENPIIERLRLWVQRKEGERAVKKSDRIIALSKFVHNFLTHRLNVPNAKIDLVYHGIDAVGGTEISRPSSLPGEWEEGFVFTAGSIRPARGLRDVLHALKKINSTETEDLKLVIAGSPSANMNGYHNNLKQWIGQNGLTANILWAGNLNEGEMAWCYQNCRAFIMTSRVESFGMIAGEAMAYGCLCISADSPCLPEIFGDAGMFYPSGDGDRLADLILSLLSLDEGQRHRSSKKSRIRAAQFSWDTCAEKTVSAILKSSPGTSGPN